MAMMLRVPWNQTSRQHTFTLTILTSDGESIGEAQGMFTAGRGAKLPPGMSQLFAMKIDAQGKLPRPGIYEIIVTIDDTEAKRFQFLAVEREESAA